MRDPEAQRRTGTGTTSHSKSNEELSENWVAYQLGALPDILTTEVARTPSETHLIVFVDLDASLGWEPPPSQGNPVQFSCGADSGLSTSRPPSR